MQHEMQHEFYIFFTPLNKNLIATDGLKFQFATDGEGKYGYLGADGSLIPFSSNYTIIFILEIERLNGLNSSLSKKQETYHIYVNNGAVTTDFEEIGAYNSDGAKGWTYVRLVSISISDN